MADSDVKSTGISRTAPQYIAALAATGGALAAGTTLGWSSPIENLIVNDSKCQNYPFLITNEDFSWVGSLITLGAAFVCLVIGSVIQMIGRKLTMLVLVVPFTIGWALVTFATNISMLFIGRFLLGISGGSFCVVAPAYTAEISQPSIRGTLGTYFQLMLVVGILFSYVVGSYANVFLFNLMCASLPIIFGVIFMFMPETPTFLISKGKKEAAMKSMIWLRGDKYDHSQELAEIQAQHEADMRNKVSIISALGRRSTKKAIFISFGLMFFQQMCGVNAVIFFTKSIFDGANTGIDAGIATIIVGIIQVISVFISTIIVDQLGRRACLIPSALVMCLSNILLGTYFFMQSKDVNSVTSLGWLPLTSLCMFIILFSIGFGPIPWLMMGELFSNDIKGLAGSVAGAFNWLLAFLVTSTFATLKATFGDGQTFWIFSGFCMLGLLFVVFFVVETKEKSLNDIQRILAGEEK